MVHRYAAIGFNVLRSTEIVNCDNPNKITTRNLFGYNLNSSKSSASIGTSIIYLIVINE
jgi:hypothetical protein